MRNLLLFFLCGIALTLSSCNKKKVHGQVVDQWKDYRKAASLMYKNNDSAFLYFNKVVITVKDSLQIAMALNNMAVIQSDAGDYFGSQESLLASLKYLDENNESHQICLSSDYNELGRTCSNLKNYSAAIQYYDLSISHASDNDYKLVVMNNKAYAYQQQKNYKGALDLYQRIRKETAKTGEAYARLMNNIATTKWLADPDYPAANELLKSLSMRVVAKDEWGRNSSYAQLSDYYTLTKSDSALVYAKQMYDIAQHLSSPDDQLEALQKLIKLSPGQLAKRYFIRYNQLNDSIQTARNAAKNQFALIRYNTEKHKADKLKLQKENADKNYQITKQWTVILIIFTLTIAGVITLTQRSRRMQVETEAKAKQELQDYQLSTSKKIHDVVANGLYQVMAEIEHQPELDKEILATRIDILYKQSRAISYNRSLEFNYQDFDLEITDMLTSFSSPQITFITAGNEATTWDSVSVSMFNEIKNVLLELLINMKKHSHADRVVLRFQRDHDSLHIRYQDNGIGLPQPTNFGNGLNNTGNRIKTINGSITFGSINGAGLLIKMSIPIA